MKFQTNLITQKSFTLVIINYFLHSPPIMNFINLNLNQQIQVELHRDQSDVLIHQYLQNKLFIQTINEYFAPSIEEPIFLLFFVLDLLYYLLF